MPASIPFYIIDVFAEEPLAGNPLALVAQAERLPEPLQRAVAREFNQSETTFLLPPRNPAATWRLRSFTPTGAEVVGAGHNALGAWWWLASEGGLALSNGAGQFAQELGDRVLPVEIVASESGRPEAVIMAQAPPSFGAAVDDLHSLAAALGLALSDLRTDIPAQVVDTGAAHLLVPAVDREAVDRSRPEAAKLLSELRHAGAQGCYLFSLDPVDPEHAAYTRFFNPTVGTWEDPAKGSAAGPLASHLTARGLAPHGAPVWIEQGHSLGRPSLLRVQVDGRGVHLSGAGIVVAEGTLRL